MKILYLSSEVVPFSKTGGLADVAGALPKALKAIGHDIRIFTPRYKKTKKAAVLPGSEVPVDFFEDEKLFGDREELYQVKGKDYPDNLERFAAFCRGALALVKANNWRPDIIHANDWQSGLAVAYLKTILKDDPFFKRTAAVYTIHNMDYLGLFPKEKFAATGLDPSLFGPAGLEFWGQVSLAKAGLVYADAINTVSESYSREIQTPEFGAGLDGLLRFRAADVYGIINGVDYEIWNPATDPNIPKRYSPATVSLKVENKLELQKQNGLPVDKNIPVLGLISRLADQKGFDLLAGALEEIMKEELQLIVLGTGEPKYHQLLEAAKKKYPDKLGINLKFDAMLAELVYAGSDLFLMPSRYEPCGLGQLISFKYGTVPIVRKTGGLADTVQQYEAAGGAGTGFVFKKYEAKALAETIRQALVAFAQKGQWSKLQEKIMKLDYSWDASAKKYVTLYMKALNKVIK